MRSMTRWSCLSLAALLALAQLTACSGEKPASADTTTAAETTAPIITEAPVEQYAIIENRASSFTIVRAETSSETVTQAAIALRKTLEDKFGCAMTISTDWVKREEDIPTDTCEILVGTTNRAESKAAAEAMAGGEFIVDVVSPNRIVILGYNDAATVAAVNAFMAQYVEPAEGTSFSLAADTRFDGAVYDAYAQIREIESHLIAAPSIITRAASADDLAGLDTASPATVIVDFTDGKAAGVTISEAMKQIIPDSIPAFRVETQADAEALMQQIALLSIKDYFVMTSNPEIIAYAVETDSNARGILHYTGLTEHALTEEELYAIRTTANSCFARVVLLPEWMADTETVAYLQKLLVTVWVDGGNDDTTTELVQMITSGTNGIVTAKRAELEACYTKYFQKNTLSRRFFVIGHRGIPSQAPENTIEGSLLGYANGADIIENDIYLSADGEVVVMHDSTIDRTTNGTGKIESMTLAQLKTYYVNKQFGDKYPNCEIPTLAEYFEAFKDNDAHIFIEIKSKKTAIVKKMYEIIQKYDFEDRVSIIAFGTDIMRECKEVCPQISLGYLVSNYSDPNDAYGSAVKVSELVGDYHTTFNPNYASVSAAFITAAHHRGITLWPWTLNDAANYYKYIFWGANGVTTNYANYSAEMYRGITADSYAIDTKVGTAVTPALTLDRYDRTEEAIDLSKLEIIFLEGESLAKVDGATVTPTGAGTISFIYSYEGKTLTRQSYRVVTQPITINAT